MQEPILTGREVGGDSATHEWPTGGIHGDGIVGARKQVNKLEFFTDSINQDGLSSNWNQIHTDKETPIISKGISHGLSTQEFWENYWWWSLLPPTRIHFHIFIFYSSERVFCTWNISPFYALLWNWRGRRGLVYLFPSIHFSPSTVPSFVLRKFSACLSLHLYNSSKVPMVLTASLCNSWERTENKNWSHWWVL